MLRHAYTLAPGEGLEAALARFTPAQLAYMRAHNLIRVIERPATDAVHVQRAANAFAAWRQQARRQVHARTRRCKLYTPEDRAQARRLLRQYRVARRMHLRLQQRRVHVLYRCFWALRGGYRLPTIFHVEDRAQARRVHLRLQQRRVHVLYRCFRALRAPLAVARLVAARRGLQRFRLAVQVHKRLAKHDLRAMCGPFRALDALRRMAVWVPRLLMLWRHWVRGCARQRRGRLLVAAAGSPLCLRRCGGSWTLPSGMGRPMPCVGCGQ